MYRGDIAPSQILDFKFTTVAASTGVPTQLAGTPAISVYQTNSTTQSTTGVTLTVDFDSVTGMNHVRIDTSADGTFYAAGRDFQVVITTGTVGGSSVVGYVVAEFSINNRSVLRPTVAGRTLDVSSGGEAGIDWANIGSPTTAQTLSGTSTKALEPTTAGRTLDVTATGAAGVDWANVEGQSTSVALSATSVLITAGTGTGQLDAASGVVKANVTQLVGVAQSATDLKDFADDGYDPATNKVQGVVLTDTVTTYTGNTPQTGDAYARLGAPAGASVSADVAAIQSDTNDIQTRIPAALVSGRIDASVGAVAAGAITATAIADGAIDRATFAADTGLQAVRSNTAAAGGAGSITLDAGASATDDFYSGCLVYLTGGTGAGQVRLIVDYVGSTQVATVTPNWATTPNGTTTFAVLPTARVSLGAWQEVVPNALISGRVDSSVGSYPGNTAQTGDAFARLGAPAGASVSADIAGVQSDTNDIQTRLPAALVSGRIDASVGAMAADTITASALAASAAEEIADAVWDEPLAGHLTAGSTGAALNAAGAAGDPWSTAIPGAYGAGSAGYIVGNNLDAAITSRLAPTVSGRTLDVTTTGEAGIDWANIGAPTTTQLLSGTTVKTATDVETDTQDIQSRLPAALVSGRIDASIGAMAANTLTASALATDAVGEIADGVWDEALAGHSTAGSAGKALSDAGAAGDPWSTALPGAYGAGTAGHIIGTAIPDIAPGAANGLLRAGVNDGITLTNGLTSFGPVVIAPNSGNNEAVYLAGRNRAGLAIYGGAGTATPAVEIYSQGSGAAHGVQITGNQSGAGINVTPGATGNGISVAGGATSGDAVRLTAANGDGLDASSVAGGVPIRGNITGDVTGNLSGSVGSVTAGVTLAASAVQAIWDALSSALTTAGSIGKRLVDYVTGDSFTRLGAPAGASVSADIAAVKAETASIQSDTNDIQTRLPAALVSGRMDSSVGSYPGNTPQTGDSFARLGAPVGASVSADIAALPTASENADGLLNRSLATGADGGRTVQDALRPLRNRVTVAAGTVTVYEEDDTTAAWTGAATTNPAAEPIIEVNPT